MRIGELADRVGLRTSALRYYESIGILAPAGRIAGRRQYDHEALNTLRLLQAAQHAGFTLAEARALLSLLKHNHRASQRWRETAQAKLHTLDGRIARLRAARAALAAAIDCACAGRAAACVLVAKTPARGGAKRAAPAPLRAKRHRAGGAPLAPRRGGGARRALRR